MQIHSYPGVSPLYIATVVYMQNQHSMLFNATNLSHPLLLLENMVVHGVRNRTLTYDTQPHRPIITYNIHAHFLKNSHFNVDDSFKKSSTYNHIKTFKLRFYSYYYNLSFFFNSLKNFKNFLS
jgi:hypothetical protein